jgi:hypothetical protein
MGFGLMDLLNSYYPQLQIIVIVWLVRALYKWVQYMLILWLSLLGIARLWLKFSVQQLLPLLAGDSWSWPMVADPSCSWLISQTHNVNDDESVCLSWCWVPNWAHDHYLVYVIYPLWWEDQVKVKVILQPTVTRPVYPGIRPPSGSCDQFFFHFHGN